MAPESGSFRLRSSSIFSNFSIGRDLNPLHSLKLRAEHQSSPKPIDEAADPNLEKTGTISSLSGSQQTYGDSAIEDDQAAQRVVRTIPRTFFKIASLQDGFVVFKISLF